MKKLLAALGCMVVVLVTLIALAVFNLDLLVKIAANRFTSRVTKTEMKLDDARISLRSGELTLKGLVVGNPEGFQAPHGVKVKSIFANLDEKTLFKDTIVLDLLEVVGPELTYEKGAGTDNFKTIMNNVKASVQREKTARKETGQEEGQGKEVVIRDLIVRDGTVRLFMPTPTGQSMTASFSELHLRDLGKGGASASEIVAQILAALNSRIISAEVEAELKKGFGGAGSQVDKAGKDARRELEKAGDRLKGLLGQ